MLDTVEDVRIQFVTKEEIIEVIAEGVNLYGDKTNPRSIRPGSSACVYQKANPEPTENSWCIIGYVAKQMGWDMPGEDLIVGAGSVAREMGWPVDFDTRDWMDRVQCIFDGINRGAGPDMDRTWKQSFQMCIEKGWLESEEDL